MAGQGLVFFGTMPRTARIKVLAVVDIGIAVYLVYFARL
jgi:hypothetical protein